VAAARLRLDRSAQGRAGRSPRGRRRHEHAHADGGEARRDLEQIVEERAREIALFETARRAEHARDHDHRPARTRTIPAATDSSSTAADGSRDAPQILGRRADSARSSTDRSQSHGRDSRGRALRSDAMKKPHAGRSSRSCASSSQGRAALDYREMTLTIGRAVEPKRPPRCGVAPPAAARAATRRSRSRSRAKRRCSATTGGTTSTTTRSSTTRREVGRSLDYARDGMPFVASHRAYDADRSTASSRTCASRRRSLLAATCA
jgi:hypothetical protein